MSARRIAVLTMARSEYGLYRPLLRAICDEPALELQLVIGAAHLDPQYNTVQEIEADGFAAAAHIPAPLEGDGPAAIANIMAKIAAGVAEALDRLKPDMIVVLGDRSEMAAAVLAATPFVIPIAHVAGGATSRAFQATLQNLVNPYGQGDAASRMTALLKAVPLNEKLLMKRDF